MAHVLAMGAGVRAFVCLCDGAVAPVTRIYVRTQKAPTIALRTDSTVFTHVTSYLLHPCH